MGSGGQFKRGKHLFHTDIAISSSSYEIISRTEWMLPLWITEGDLVDAVSKTARNTPVKTSDLRACAGKRCVSAMPEIKSVAAARIAHLN